jgi:hypothetical protein
MQYAWLSLKDRARVHPFAGNGGSWREAAIYQRIAPDQIGEGERPMYS